MHSRPADIGCSLKKKPAALDLDDHDVKVTEQSAQRRHRSVAVAIATTALVVAAAALAAVAVLTYISNEVFDNELPSCDADPVVLEWTQGEGLWQRSATFELLEDSQTVQVDVMLHRDDGGVIQVGKNVYVIAAGGSFPVDDETTPTTQPFQGTVVGRGIDGVNEQVTLEAGEWQLIVRGGASPVDVRWPC